MSDTRPILVTGAHRSGTTWVGKMLALAPGVGYIHEPFSPYTLPGISGAPFDRTFAYVTSENEAPYLPHLARTMSFRYNVGQQAAAVRTPRDAARGVRDGWAFGRARMRRARPLVKDPIALLSAEWLAERFDMEVVVTIRHPAAFVASVQRLGWTHRFDTFLDERLLRDRLGAFEDDIRRRAADPGDTLGQAVLLWRILYTVVDGYRSRHPDWVFLRHEDAARDPLGTFASLYSRLGLDLTERVRHEIVRHSAAGNPTVARSPHGFQVDSAANAESWRSRLDPADIARVRESTADVWPRFYSDDDW